MFRAYGIDIPTRVVCKGVKVEIWSDVLCPWCYLGKRRLESALARFEHAAEVEVVWRSFELDPGAPRVPELPPSEHLQQKYGWSAEQVEASWERLRALGAAEGLEMNMHATRRGNSLDAHRLLHLAHERGRQEELKERFLRAYFTESEAIGDPEVLGRLAVETGLDRDEVRDVLASDRYMEEVRADERTAQLLGINGVPFFVVGERYGISGAQPAELMQAALERAWSERVEAA
jgi:predicted DsbA family dithiol-disulfide isomerase